MGQVRNAKRFDSSNQAELGRNSATPLTHLEDSHKWLSDSDAIEEQGGA